MVDILDKPATTDQLIAWNEGSYDDLGGLSHDMAVNEIVTSISLLGPTDEQRAAFASDISDVLMGSAIEVTYTIGGRKVEFEFTDSDEAVVSVDGVEIVRYDAGDVA